jgi:hypothetical protein
MPRPDPIAIIQLRQRVLNASAAEQPHIRAAFAQSFPAWADATAWTFRVKEVGDDGRERPVRQPHVPFVLWPCQRSAAVEVIEGIEAGRDVVIRKSRDMGASWLVSAIAVWGWMFKGWQSLLVSRVEDLVDRTGDPDSLFWKLDYLLSSQPRWLLPCEPDALAKGGTFRQHMVLRHPESGATITGQASTEHIGRGGRRTFVLFDEFAALDNAAAAWRSAADCTSCRVANSTPIGAGSEYSRLVATARTKGEPRLVELMYWDHPEKGEGAEQRIDEDGTVTGFAGSPYTWSPWLAEQAKRRDRVDLAQNVFAESVGSGAAFFPSHIVTKHRDEHAADPKRCEIVRGKLVREPQGRWRVWGDPTRATEYVVFIDPSHGTGSANSAACVMDATARRVVAEFVDPNISTYDLALEVANAARRVWRGRRATLVGWETNGPGATLQHDFERAQYPAIYRQRQTGTTSERATRRVGWTSTKRAKRQLLGDLARALAQGEVVVPSGEALDEMLEYVILDDGSIEAGSRRDEASGAREAHGDRVIALAGAFMLCGEAGPAVEEESEYGADTLGSILKHDDVTREW